MIIHAKLVRDEIPEVLRNKGISCITHTAEDDTEYMVKLHEKLLEEANEFKDDPCTEELADIFEVLYAIIDFHGFNVDDIRLARKKKKFLRGGFKERIILDSTDE